MLGLAPAMVEDPDAELDAGGGNLWPESLCLVERVTSSDEVEIVPKD
jgi:hypothetical protein